MKQSFVCFMANTNNAVLYVGVTSNVTSWFILKNLVMSSLPLGEKSS